MRVVMLVPWRPDRGHRDKHWEFVKPHLEALGYPLFTGDAPGPWARSAACNAASKNAGRWDVAIVNDADTVLETGPVARAVELVSRTGGAARPHDRRYMLSLGASKMAINKGIENLPEKYLRWTSPGGGAVVISRNAWDEIGGYDERFIGWGYEDSDLGIRLATGPGWQIVPGRAWHLWHAGANIRSASARRNLALLEELRESKRHEIARASRKAGFDLNTVL